MTAPNTPGASRTFATDEALRATYTRELPYRPNWPRTFEQAKADPLILRVLDLLTRHQTPSITRLRLRVPHHTQNPELQAIEEAPPPRAFEPLPDDAEIGACSPARPALNGRRVPDSMRPRIDNKSRAAGEKENAEE